MAAYPSFTKQDLATYSGRDVATYTDYSGQALMQAELLFKIGTCLAGFPDDPTGQAMANYAILSMADAIVLAQPYQAVLSNPFTSESIGSYSYNKMATKVAAGLPTGVSWFDIAVTQLSVCDINDGVPRGGGIEVFEHDGTFASGAHKGNARLLSPQDIDSSRTFGFDPAPGYQVPPVGVYEETELIVDPEDPGYLIGG